MLRVLEVVGELGLFPGLERLEALSVLGNDVPLAAAAVLNAGGLSALQELSIFGSVEEGPGFEALVRALEGSPCARTLRLLHVGDVWHKPVAGREASRGIQALVAAIGAGHFPALVELRIHGVSDSSLVALAAGFSAAGNSLLETLKLYCVLSPRDAIIALASALRDGRLGSRLRELRFSGCETDEYMYSARDGGSMMDRGRVGRALVQAFVEGKRFVGGLEVLDLVAVHMWIDEAKAFVHAVVCGCPFLKKLEISSENINVREQRALKANVKEAFGRRRGSEILSCLRFILEDYGNSDFYDDEEEEDEEEDCDDDDEYYPSWYDEWLSEGMSDDDGW